MSAGDSAGAEARRQLALADAHAAAAAEARATAARYSIADVTEKATAQTLAPLAAVGHYLLADRRWPGSRRAQVDLVVVGPGGVFIVDTKAWKDVAIHHGRIHRGQEDVTDDVLALAGLAYTAEGELAEVGLAPGEVHAAVVLAGRKDVNERIGPVRVVGEKDVLRLIASRGSRLTPGQVDVVLAKALTVFAEVNAPAPVSVTVAEPVLPQPAPAPVQDSLLSEEEVQSALLEGMLASPIEEWMTFLHPSQAKLVRRSFNGPCRIRGAAGTGKTVVGLHRAAYLARTQPGRILVTTFVRTLPGVLGQMLRRMAPDVVDRVDFAGVHEFARRVLDERGVTVRVDSRQIDLAFTRAWEAVAATSTLGGSVKTARYWKEEIDYVLKGRGLTRFEQYADLTRTGRGHPLTVDQRRAVWELYCAYDAELRRAKVNDYADVVLLAEAELRRAPLAEPYAAVIVDEAQDLTCAMVRLLHGLVGDGPDAFTLIGDGQQSIYPGGYSLAELGISLAGRGVVMDVNYRNTAQILEFAQRMVAGDQFADIEGAVARGDLPSAVPRRGVEPVIERCATWGDRGRRLVARARAVLHEVGTSPGDVGVLCLTHKGVQAATQALTAAGLPVVQLQSYDGSPVDAIKVGTIKRAKGLEFKQVLIGDAWADQIGDAAPPAEGTERERWELRRRELYVGMTRARDGLWVGVT
ncbi:UvrD-helicase domain-containing protein [Cellulomonas sp. APG4]|uniref:nuclease-related domain-containing DEAD/DEAH box helicase n=1 Tax=Cellulomonas sp. APG4 TaxID=1538656 RepID=UPI00137A0531|nr:UvrD-helicase domain-containing protein [Cellulomonas sp. APG4]NCT91856.1 UvrD-helicase domain-containing protein [Cellulomonas sp. APG4]